MPQFIKKIVALAVLLTLLVGCYLLYFAYQDNAIDYYARELLSASANAVVSYNDNVYEIVDGTIVGGDTLDARSLYDVLRLAYSVTAVSRQPIMALEGTNADTMLQAVAHLEVSTQRLIMHQTSEKEARLVRALYPTDYLRALAELELKRKLFLASGSPTALQNYNDQLQKTIALKAREITLFEKAFRRAVDTSQKSFVTSKELVNRDVMLEGVEAMLKRNVETADVQKRRETCFSGLYWRCDHSFISLPNLSAQATFTDTGIDMGFIRTVRHLFSSYRLAAVDYDNSFVLLNDSTCIDTSRHVPIYGTRREPPNERKAVFMGDMRFIESNTISIPYFTALKDKGVHYVPTREFNYYECPLYGNDFGAVFAIDNIRDYVKKRDLSYFYPEPHKSTIRRLMTELTDEVAEETTAAELINAALHSPALQGSIDAVHYLHLVELALQLKNRSARFDIVISDIANITNLQLRKFDEAVPVELTATYLFFLRNGFFALHSASNKSFGEIKYVFEKKPLDLVEPYVYLSDVLSRGESIESILEDLRVYAQIGNPL